MSGAKTHSLTRSNSIVHKLVVSFLCRCSLPSFFVCVAFSTSSSFHSQSSISFHHVLHISNYRLRYGYLGIGSMGKWQCQKYWQFFQLRFARETLTIYSHCQEIAVPGEKPDIRNRSQLPFRQWQFRQISIYPAAQLVRMCVCVCNTYFWSSVSKPSECTISSMAPTIDITDVEHLSDAVQLAWCDWYDWLRGRVCFGRRST